MLNRLKFNINQDLNVRYCLLNNLRLFYEFLATALFK